MWSQSVPALHAITPHHIKVAVGKRVWDGPAAMSHVGLLLAIYQSKRNQKNKSETVGKHLTYSSIIKYTTLLALVALAQGIISSVVVDLNAFLEPWQQTFILLVLRGDTFLFSIMVKYQTVIVIHAWRTLADVSLQKPISIKPRSPTLRLLCVRSLILAKLFNTSTLTASDVSPCIMLLKWKLSRYGVGESVQGSAMSTAAKECYITCQAEELLFLSLVFDKDKHHNLVCALTDSSHTHPWKHTYTPSLKLRKFSH